MRYVVVLLLVSCGRSHGPPGDASRPDAAERDGARDASDSGVADAPPDSAAADAPDGDIDDDACVPACGDRTCGPDFCGALCGGRVCTPGSESFEDLVRVSDFSRPFDTPELLPSGLHITGPSPNPPGTANARVADCGWEDGGGYHGLVCDRDERLIPDGTAFVGYTWWTAPLEFELPADSSRVRLRVATTTGTESWEVRIVALNSTGETVDAWLGPIPSLNSWATPIVLESTEIRSVRFTRDPEVFAPLVLDLVEWE